MQPYFLPYIGYWQLLGEVDRFVVYDDVNYIKRGWINRNRILINGKPAYITIPLVKASQNKHICTIDIDDSSGWRGKARRSIDLAYRRAPYFDETIPVIEAILETEEENLARFLLKQLKLIAQHLGIRTTIIGSSQVYQNVTLQGSQRILDICQRESATSYVNLPGGRDLYDKDTFSAAGIDLEFLTPNPRTYPQLADEFCENLSVVDVLMSVGRDGMINLMSQQAT